MKVFRSFIIPKTYLNSVIAIGNFDGVHIGHQEVIKEAVRVSNKKKVGVLTFEPHPKCFFRKEFFFFQTFSFQNQVSSSKRNGCRFYIKYKF